MTGTSVFWSPTLAASMLAHCAVDADLRTGPRSEGLFFSANSLMQKAIGGLGVLTSGIILEIISFPARAVPGQVEQAVLNDMVFKYVPISGTLYLIGSVCLYFYRIDRDKHEATLKKLQESGENSGHHNNLEQQAINIQSPVTTTETQRSL
jgi:Na+/melibiose symporter-like transporter